MKNLISTGTIDNFRERFPVTTNLKPWHLGLCLLLFLLLVPFPLFYDLDGSVLRIWDEARRGVNAYEMLHDGNVLVAHYDGEPDMWGTKPTLLVATQAAFMLLLGPGELAVRLPAAIAGLLTCFILLVFAARYFQNPWLGLLWAVVLVTCNGYVDVHGTRTGDFDAPLTFFMLLYALSFFRFTESKKTKYILFTAIFLTFAVLMKGIAGLLFLPGLLLWALAAGSLKAVMISRQTWIGAAVFVVLVGGYYLAREWQNPGFLSAVSENELGGRYLQTLEKHDYPSSFYLTFFMKTRLKYWVWLVIPAIFSGFLIKEKSVRNLHYFSIILLFSHLAIISFSRTKLRWYDLPEYPLIAMIIGNFLWLAMRAVQGIPLLRARRNLAIVPALMIIFIFIRPVQMAFDEVVHPIEPPRYLADHEISQVLREGLRGKKNLDSTVLVHEGYDAHCRFYLYLLEDAGQTVIRKNKEELQPGDLVLAHQEKVKEYIGANYLTEVVEERKFVRAYNILFVPL